LGGAAAGDGSAIRQLEGPVSGILESGSLLLALLNPFLLVVYLTDLISKLDRSQFRRVLVRAGLIAAAAFCSFAVLGDVIFSRVIHAEFASFQIFGGLVFVLIGLQFVFRGPTAIEILRGDSAHIAGAVAMPVLIGPGTISASVVIGKRHEPLVACAVVLGAVALSLLIVLVLKGVHDYVRPRNEALVERYIEIAGRITALYVGTVAVQMIMQGISDWLTRI
jgi:small neutral amino acid transporter SnatA (MarC family)